MSLMSLNKYMLLAMRLNRPKPKVTFMNKCGSIKFLEKMRPAKTKRFFTHCFGLIEIRMSLMDLSILVSCQVLVVELCTDQTSRRVTTPCAKGGRSDQRIPNADPLYRSTKSCHTRCRIRSKRYVTEFISEDSLRLKQSQNFTTEARLPTGRQRGNFVGVSGESSLKRMSTW